jgi:hypothetical protein
MRHAQNVQFWLAPSVRHALIAAGEDVHECARNQVTNAGRTRSRRECALHSIDAGVRNDAGMGEQRVLEIGTVTLEWSDWVPWGDLLSDNRGGAGVLIPNRVAGVYEVRSIDKEADDRPMGGYQQAGRIRGRVAPHVSCQVWPPAYLPTYVVNS